MKAALKVAFHRGRLAAQLSNASEATGTMLATRLSEAEVNNYLNNLSTSFGECKVVIGCYNSPKSLTLSGDKQQLLALKKLLIDDNVFVRELKVDVAYHSYQMRSISLEYLHSIQDLEKGFTGTKEPLMLSTVTGDVILPSALTSSQYWVDNLLSPVQFSQVIKRICAREELPIIHRFLEIGPHSVLQGPIRECWTAVNGPQNRYASLLTRGSSGTSTFLHSLGHLFCAGFSVNLSAANQKSSHDYRPSLLIDLPAYPFDHSEKYWITGRLDKNYRMREHGRNWLLGTPILDWNPQDAVWSNTLRLSELPWLDDHKINCSVLYPAPGMLVMAIEAIYQVAQHQENISSFEIQSVIFHKSVVIPEDGKETRFSLRQLRDVTNALSPWYEFILYVYEDDTFQETCRGEIRTYSENMAPGEGLRSLSGHHYRESFKMAKIRCRRRINQNRFYQQLKVCGLDYGQNFQNLKDIGFGGQNEAVSEVELFRSKDLSVDRLSTHVVHPTSLDAIAHSMFIILTSGATKMMPTNIPTRLERVWVAKNGLCYPQSVSADIHTSCKRLGPRIAKSSVTVLSKDTEEPLVLITGLETSTVAEMEVSVFGHADENQCFMIENKPDITLLEKHELKTLLQDSHTHGGPRKFFDKLTLFLNHALTRLRTNVSQSTTTDLPPHLKKYLVWAESIQNGFNSSATVPDLVQLGNEIASFSALGRLFYEVAQNLEQIIHSNVSIHELLFSGALARDYYREVYTDTNLGPTLTTYLDLLSYKNPHLKILEIGAGTGGATKLMLNTLCPDGEDIRKFGRYTFTDVSHSFFHTAREELGTKAEGLEFELYDIESSPESQNLDVGGYDLVVAFGVLHLADDLNAALKGARKLLKKYALSISLVTVTNSCRGGKLIMSEIVRTEILRGGFIWGLFPDWWRGDSSDTKLTKSRLIITGHESNRQWGPCVSESSWDEALLANGFSGAELVVPDFNDESCHELSLIISTAIENEDPCPNFPPICIVLDERSEMQSELANQLNKTLRSLNNDVYVRSESFHSLEPQKLCLDSLYICLMEIEMPVLFDVDETVYNWLQRFFLSAKNILWVTNGGGMLESPGYGIIDGLSRVLRTERSDLKMATLALDFHGSRKKEFNPATKHIAKIVSGFSQPQIMDEEYTERDGLLEVNRLTEERLMKNTLATLQLPSETETLKFQDDMYLYLHTGTVGLLSTLEFIEDRRKLPPKSGEVEIQVYAAGLNFSDYLVATGKINREWLGSDCAGVITRTSDTAFQVGDLVMACCASTLRTHVQCSSALVTKIPEGLDFATAASIPTVLTLAHYTLVEVARIRKGDLVLVHCGASGVGQAAIQIAKHFGTEVFATVSSKEKQQFLVKELQVPEENILISTGSSFPGALKALTRGREFNIVLSLFSDERSNASMHLLAPGGHFLDIALGSATRKVSFANSQISYTRIDFSFLLESRPKVVMKSVMACLSLLSESCMEPPTGLHKYSISEVEEAFRSLQDKNRTGKIVIEFTKASPIKIRINKTPWVEFDPNSTYLIAGGLGGLGRNIAQWMVRCGAKHLILLSRSGPRKEELEFIQKLRSQGVQVDAPPCDISDSSQLKSVLDQCSYMPPIGGCIQAAVVLEVSRSDPTMKQS
jgi:NADPH:quinone reductase-like Zn-dependent oxidoreductase/acyl transferase domain-containing protein